MDKALKGVESSISKTQSSLKDVNKLLKLDPTNTQLLQQKHRLLAEQIENTSSKLNSLKEADKQAKSQLESGELGQDKYDALKREIVDTEEKLKALKKEAGSGNTAFAVISEGAEKASEKTEKLANSLKPISAAAAAVGAASVATAAEFEAGMDEVLAISGATEEQFQQLQDKAIELGAKTKFSASESADAFKYMAMAGWDAESMLDGIEGIMNLAAASGEDLALTSDIVTDSLTAFGLTAGDSAHFADVLAMASSKSNTNVSLLGETFKYVAPVAGALGYSVEDTAVAIGLMANSGIKGSQAGTALRSTLTNLTKPTDTIAAAMDKYNISLTDTEGNMKPLDQLMLELRDRFDGLTESEKASLAATLAGKEGMSGLLAIVNSSDKDFQTLSEQINNASGAASNMAGIMMDNTAGAIEQLNGALESAAIVIGEKLSPYIRKLAEFVTSLVEKFSTLSDEQLDVIITVGMIVAALAPLFGIISKVTAGISGLSKILSTASGAGAAMSKIINVLKTGISGLKTAFSALFGLIAAHPIIAIVMAIIAVIVVLYNKCEWFRDGIKSILTAIGDFFVNLDATIEAIINEFITEVAEAVNLTIECFQQLLTNIGNILGKVLNLIQTSVTNIKTSAVNGFNNMVSGIKNTVSKITGIVQKGFQGAIDFITSLPSKAVTWGQDFIQGLINGITSKISSVANAVEGVAQKIASYVHFSRPDVGPLHYYEKWMPDFMDGLTKGIYENIPKVARAAEAVAETLSYDAIKSPQTNQIDPNAIYNAVRKGSESAVVYAVIDGRSFDRGLRDRGVMYK